MKKIAILAATAAVAFAAPAMAQDVPQVGAYVGASAGYHDLGLNEELADVGITDPKDGGFLYGVVGGFDIPVGDQGLTIGLEGNFHLGSDAIDSDYGIATKLGFRTGAAKLFVKGGYQWINLDVDQLTGGQVSEAQFRALGQDDTVDDYLVGVGGEFDVGPRTKLTVGVDTVSFDTVRGTVGLGFRF